MDDQEVMEWYALSPAERFAESQKLWEVFLLFGGTCEPKPDTESPFYHLQFERQSSTHGRASVHPLRRR